MKNQVLPRVLMVVVAVKKKWTCFVSKKPRHHTKDCSHYKVNNAQINMIENVDEEAI